ncbi:MAG: carboxylesterase family protein [Gammaproteobacteria bacterium]|jgi:para-nitrobenzyl esterase|nr:carboxylesterase family protein [Gammaproteobacteria bacterium]
MRYIVLIVLGFVFGCAEQGTQPADTAKVLSTEVKVTGGEIVGRLRENDLFEFRGIPFAAAPVGDLRWQPPQPVNEWEGKLDATEPGLPCVQPATLSEFYASAYFETSEDCLTLNVWSRATTTKDKIPVMVWIHGGALVMGSGRDYDGAPLTEKGVVLVTINYRLGPFGFFAHPELSSEDPGGISGNQGFRDQIAALEWVRDNIEVFGGDPDNVTIFGESAGSWSMSVMQASPMARGLFHKVIGQSGARFIPIPDLTADRWGIPSAESWGETLGAKFTGSDEAGLVDLRALPAQEIMDVYSKDPQILMNFDYLTVVDGAVLPKEVNTIFESGNQADVPVLIGSNADEATTFDPGLLNPNASNFDYGEALSAQVSLMLPNADESIFDHYPAEPKLAKQSWVEFSTDVMFTQPMRLWADYMQNVSSPAYLYWWDWSPIIDGSDQYGAFHAAEVPYVFGDLSIFNMMPRQEDREFSELMMTIWTNFAKTGDPSVEGAIEWPPYAPESSATAILGEKLTIQAGVRSDRVTAITAAHSARRASN